MAQSANADEFPFVRNNFGTVGMIDMPSARMAPDGSLSIGATYFQNNQRYDLGFQALPWLETDIRYSGLDHFDPQFPVYWDRSFAIKARFWQESDFLPAVALGVNDLIGTGIYSGEYLVASKRFGNLDFSAGIGWGRLSGAAQFKNPFSIIFPSFSKPRENSTGNAGGTNFGVYFHGPNSGVFGGVVWQTPIKDLSLIAEYSSDPYSQETASGNFRPVNQINYGLSYSVTDSMSFGLNWLYGRSFGGEISFQLDPTRSAPAVIGASLPPAPAARTPKQQQAALNLLKDGSPSPSIALRASELADALWKTSSNLTDVAVQGQVLSISISKGNLERACEAMASIAGQYSLTLKGVMISNGAKHASCPVKRMPALVLLEASSPVGNDGLARMLVPISAPIITIDARNDPEPDAGTAIALFRTDVAKQRLELAAVNVSGAEAIIYYTNATYFSEMDALNRLIRVAMQDLPPDVEKFKFIATNDGVPQREFDVLRAPAERSFAQNDHLSFMGNVFSGPAPMQNPVLTAADQGAYPKFSWDVFPQFRQQLFDPSNPLGVQFVAAATGSVELLPGLSLDSEVEGNIWNNFNTNRPSNSVLPHVRTDFTKYFTEGENGIGDLEMGYLFRLAPDVFALAKAGYLESMFAGVGGEVLWRPEGQRWAVGGDLYEVQQRAFDRLFSLQNYRVLTGHLSLYYASPWYGLNFAVRAGQYLAHDKGFTFEMTRRFSTGVEIGAFFTKTNVSAAQFGEGSFDKGIIIRIPIGWVAPINTQTEWGTVLRPVQRDGGQRLLGDTTLYDYTRRTSQSEMYLQESDTDVNH